MLSDSFQRKGGIEVTQIVHVPRQDDGTFAARNEHDGCIDDVGRTGTSAETACCFRENLIEGWNDGRGPLDERAKGHLTGGSSPHLTEHARGHDHPSPRSQRLANERTHLGVGPLERDERASV